MSIFLAVAMFAEAASATPVAVTPAGQPDPLDKMVCKRYVETGSLVKARRDCRTRRAWNRLQDDMRNETEKFIERTAISPTSG